jgi:hypothetical protein
MLKQWAKTYFLNKDLLRGRKPKVEEKEDYILITNEDESHVIVIVKEKLNNLAAVLKRFDALEKEHKAEKLTLVLYNKKKNIDLIVKSWKNLIKKPNLTILFANPDSNNKWIVTPYIHNKIADVKNLKAGLVSMYNTVEPVL